MYRYEEDTDSIIERAERQGYQKGRADAIDEFEGNIRDWQGTIRDTEYDADMFDFVFEQIYEIAEELKEQKND